MTTTQQKEVDRVLSLIASFAHQIAPHDADDLAQITLIKAWLSWDSDATAEWEDAQFKAWLYQIAKNAWMDTERKRASRPHTDELTDIHYAPTTIESGIEQREHIGIALSQLPERQRTTLLLSVQGYTYEEIAACEHESVSAVKGVVFRARKQIREEWKAA